MRKIQIAGYGIESAELPEDVEALEAQGENLEEATEALEAFALLLQPAVEGYAMNPAALTALSSVTNRLVQKVGLPSLSVGTESLVVDSLQQAASLGLEDIKEHLKNAATAVWEFIKKIGKWIAEKAKQVFGSSKAVVDSLIKSLTKVKDKQDLGLIKLTVTTADDKSKVVLALPAPKGEEAVSKEIDCDLSTLYANGKFTPDVLRQISEVAAIIWTKRPVTEKIRNAFMEQIKAADALLETYLEKSDEGTPDEEITSKFLEMRKKGTESVWREVRDAFGVDTQTGQWQGSIGSNELFLKATLTPDEPYSVCFRYVEEAHETAVKATTLKDLGLDTSKVNDSLKWLSARGDDLRTQTAIAVDDALGKVADMNRSAAHSKHSKSPRTEFLTRMYDRTLATIWRELMAVYKLNYGIEVALIKALRTLSQLANAAA